jgi:hypothetical protein
LCAVGGVSRVASEGLDFQRRRGHAVNVSTLPRALRGAILAAVREPLEAQPTWRRVGSVSACSPPLSTLNTRSRPYG